MLKNITLLLILILTIVSFILAFSTAITAMCILLIAMWMYILILEFDKVNILIKFAVFCFTIYYIQKIFLDFLY